MIRPAPVREGCTVYYRDDKSLRRGLSGEIRGGVTPKQARKQLAADLRRAVRMHRTRFRVLAHGQCWSRTYEKTGLVFYYRLVREP